MNLSAGLRVQRDNNSPTDPTAVGHWTQISAMYTILCESDQRT